jgi:hypothetical protein
MSHITRKHTTAGMSKLTDAGMRVIVTGLAALSHAQGDPVLRRGRA